MSLPFCALLGMMANPPYQQAVRLHTSVLAEVERRLLVWMANRLPARINSDHLTSAATLAMLGVGTCFWIGGGALPFVILLLAVNWFGDSLDGTLARVRRRERPRYGYYVDHVLDAVGIAALMGGLALGGHMTPIVALGFLSAYFLLTVEIALAAHACGTFRLSFWHVGPTELRILLSAGVLQLMRSDVVTLFGHRWLLFDVGCAVGIAGLLITFVVSAVRNGAALYREERLP
jgi:archaetidylinositol phosphate synthase